MFTVTSKIKEKDVKDLLCTAWEGGSTYWVHHAEVIADADHEYKWEIPFNGGSINVFPEDEEGNPEKPELLNAEALQRGLQVMRDKYQHHWKNFQNDNADAETGDVFLQCCLFGEIVYG